MGGGALQAAGAGDEVCNVYLGAALGSGRGCRPVDLGHRSPDGSACQLRLPRVSLSWARARAFVLFEGASRSAEQFAIQGSRQTIARGRRTPRLRYYAYISMGAGELAIAAVWM
mmetsp:Transcript_62712/g.204684  ORF Transcript_62712/g.204684 Transcript_62712/m.204684 type:complete len:114 (-) Transcript_62712:88-429(-)